MSNKYYCKTCHGSIDSAELNMLDGFCFGCCVSKLQSDISQLKKEINELRYDQGQWRKGVKLIANHAGLTDTLCCVTIAQKVLEMSAEIENYNLSDHFKAIEEIREKLAILLLDGTLADHQRNIIDKIYDIACEINLPQRENKKDLASVDIEALAKKIADMYYDGESDARYRGNVKKTIELITSHIKGEKDGR